MSKVCAKHIESPAFIYGECIGCELETMRAEAQALREQNTKFQHMLADVVAKHFAENIKRSTAQKSMDVYLSEGIRLLEEELAALRARVVVTHEPLARGFFHPIPEEDDYEFHDERFINGDCEQCIPAVIVRSDELARLNGNTVSEGLLRRLAIHRPGYDADHYTAVEELLALLGKGKEVGDVLVRE